MRILKKFIRKLYHLFWFLSVFFFILPQVYAIEENTNIGDTNFYTPPYATFGDVTNNTVTRYEGTSAHNIYYAPQNLITSGGNTDGMAIIFTHESLFIKDYLYSVTLLVGFSDSNIYPKGTSNRVCINHNLSDAIESYNSNIFCTTATVYTWDNVSPFTTYDGTQVYLGMISYIFTSPITAKSFIGVMNSSSYRQGYQILGGVYVEQLADNKNFSSLSAQDMHNILNNSGLASASSVSQVQQSITQIQTDINNSANNIINNQNQNTQQQIESQQVCQQYDKSSMFKDNTLLSTSGVETHDTRFVVTDYIKIDKNAIIKLIYKNNTYQANICFYNVNKTYISCQKQQDLTEGQTLTIPNSASYVRMSIEKSTDRPTWSICKNGNQALNDNITDSSIDSSDSTINNLKNQIPTNSVISDLLLLPVRFLQNFVNALNSSCSPFSLGSLLGTNLIMPCINLENYLGSTIWTMIDLIFSGMFVYGLRKKFIEIYHNITNLKNGGNEID